MKKSSFYFFFLIIYSWFLISSCGVEVQQVKKEDELLHLKNRANYYWELVKKGDVEKAYLLEHPQYREQNSILKYSNHFKFIKYEDIEITDIKIEKDKAEIKLNLTQRYMFRYLTEKKIKDNRTDRWAKYKGEWYHLPRDFNLK